jgi:hypothetical protein
MGETKSDKNDEILNQILKEMRELKNDVEEIKEELSNQPTLKDLEVFKIIEEMNKNNYFISEKEFEKKYGLKI